MVSTTVYYTMHHVLSIVQFHNTPSLFSIPKEPRELHVHRLIRVADFLGVGRFIDAAYGARWLEVDREKIMNDNLAHAAAVFNLPI